MRSRFAEDRLAEAALGPGVRQYLMIAAGLDTSAWRQPDFAQPMLLFAADHPASLQFAQGRFRACNLSRPPNLVHVPVDLERQHIGEKLSAHGFDVALPSFISMIGVAQYLTATAVDAVLQFASTLPKRSEIVVSFAVTDDQLSSSDRQAAAMSMAYTASLGEPWQTRLRPADLIARLSELGFCQTFHLTPKLAQQRYFSGRSDNLRAPGWEQLIAAVI